VELLAVYHVLVLAWGLEIKELWCYSDCKTVIKLITDPIISAWHHYATIIHNINDLLVRDWRVTLHENNVCANYLAKLGSHNLEPLPLLLFFFFVFHPVTKKKFNRLKYLPI
jgi:hypothetical protein